MPSTLSSRPRADAARNRDKILTAARDAFASGDGSVSFDALARRAGVGVATLYRNFPNRQALVEAIYHSELDDLVTLADTLLAAEPADVALRHWMDHYAVFVATKHGMAEAFQQAVATGSIGAGETRERIRTVVGDFLSHGAAAGTLRGDIDPDDATTALLGAVLGALSSGADSRQRERVLDIVVGGLRPGST